MKYDLNSFSRSFTEKYSTDSDVETMWSDLKTKFHDTMNNNVPNKFTSRKFQQPWFNSEVKRLCNKKKKWFKKMKASTSPNVREKYMKIKKECQQACRSAHSNYMKTMFDDDDKNNKKTLVIY